MKKISMTITAALSAVLLSINTIPSLAGTYTIKNGEERLKERTTLSNDTGKDSEEITGEGNGNPSEKLPVDSQYTVEKLPTFLHEEEAPLLEEKLLMDQRLKIVIDGKAVEADSPIKFYLKRSSSTNKVALPKPVTVTVTQESGDPIGNIAAVPGGILNDGRERVRVTAVGNTELSIGNPVSFTVEFVDENIGDETDKHIMSSDKSKTYLELLAGTDILLTIPIYYAADGLYSHYSAEYADLYKGNTITSGGKKYVNIGTVDLNGTTPPSFTIEHHFKPLVGTENVAIAQLQLNPDGDFIFTAPTSQSDPYTIDMEQGGERWLSISLQMKEASFLTMKNDAIAGNININKYVVLADLVIAYDDGYDGQLGYMVGGTVNPLPLVYHITYRRSNGGSDSSGGHSGGGSGGGGSSNSGGQGGGSTATVTGPAQTARTTTAVQSDIGWVEVNGMWYYLNTENQPITDWLLGLDGKWYYLGQDGVRKTGWVMVDGKWYLLNVDGTMATGLAMVNQQWYLLLPDGAMAIGWAQDPDGNWRYLLENGSMVTDYITPDGYYIDVNGIWKK